MVEEELNRFLKAIDADPPYILCAHSFAGLFARLYIRDYPDEVSGVVLIDTTHEDQYKRQALVLKPGTALLLENINDVTEDLLASTGAIGEWMNRENTFEEVRVSRFLPDIPLYFLGEDFVSFDFLPDDDEANAKNLEEELYEDMSQLTPRGILEIVPGVGHDIHEKAPQTVIKAVKAVATGNGF
jgi:pimeloyl-ACP methyl ester carboxylesterase